MTVRRPPAPAPRPSTPSSRPVVAAPAAPPAHLASATADTLDHVPALDGLRGAAVAAVVLFHAGHLDGGFLGVDLFFVLSGFLITSLLVLEHRRTGRISLGRFWARRFRRLLPALLVVLAAVSVYGVVAMPTDELGDLRRDSLGTLGYAANWVAIHAGSDYWAAYADPSPLEHTWSLAIEEQFYVLWPLLVVAALALARGRRTMLVALTVAGSAASVLSLWVHYSPGEDTGRVYYGTDTRIAAILYGAGVALWAAGRQRRAGDRAERVLGVAAVGGTAVLLVAWARASGTAPWLYEWGLPLLGVSAAVVIASVTGPRPSLLQRLLAWAPLRHLGAVSYGLYLWHWPVNVVLDSSRTGVEGWSLTILRVAVSLLLAEMSLRLVEFPIRSARTRPLGWPVALGAVAATGAVVLVSTVGATARPRSGLADEVVLAATGTPRILLVGDGAAVRLGPGLLAAGEELGIEVFARGVDGCGIAPADIPPCRGLARWRQAAADVEPDATLLVLGWDGIGRLAAAGGAARPCDPAFDAVYRSAVDGALAALGESGPVHLATVPYRLDDPASATEVDCLNAMYAAAAADFPGAVLVDLGAWACPDGVLSCRTAVDGSTLRPSGLYFEGPGALHAGRWLLSRSLEQLELVPGRLPLQVLLVGDSQATVLAEAALKVDDLVIGLRSATGLGCGTTPGSPTEGDRVFQQSQCEGFLSSWPAAAGELRDPLVVVLTGAWEVLDHEIEGEVVRFGAPAWDEAVRVGLTDALAPLAGHSLVVMTAPCFGEGDPGSFSFPSRAEPRRVERYNQLLREVAATLGASVVDYGSFVCGPSGDGSALRNDGVHLSVEGGGAVWEWLIPQLRASAGG